MFQMRAQMVGESSCQRLFSKNACKGTDESICHYTVQKSKAVLMVTEMALPSTPSGSL